MSVGSFGNIQFGLDETFSLNGEFKFPFAQIPRLNNYPSLQQTTLALDTLELRLRFSDAYNLNPHEDFFKLVEIARKRLKQNLILGKTFYGLFVINRIRYNVTRTTPNGNFQQVDTTISFLQSL